MQIFDKTGLYRLRTSYSFEGAAFSVGDFALKPARIMGQGRLVGILLEVAYRPVASPQLAHLPLEELLASVHLATGSLPGAFEPVEEPSFADYNLSADEHTSRHSALLLMQVVSALAGRRDAAATAPHHAVA